MKRLFFRDRSEDLTKRIYLKFCLVENDFVVETASLSEGNTSESKQKVSEFLKAADDAEKEAFYELISVLMTE